MLCFICQRVFHGSYRRYSYPHHYYIHELERSASEFCPICRELWTALSDPLPVTKEEKLATVSGVKEVSGLRPISIYTILFDEGTLELLFAVNKNGLEDIFKGHIVSFHLQSIKGKITPCHL